MRLFAAIRSSCFAVTALLAVTAACGGAPPAPAVAPAPAAPAPAPVAGTQCRGDNDCQLYQGPCGNFAGIAGRVMPPPTENDRYCPAVESPEIVAAICREGSCVGIAAATSLPM